MPQTGLWPIFGTFDRVEIKGGVVEVSESVLPAQPKTPSLTYFCVLSRSHCASWYIQQFLPARFRGEIVAPFSQRWKDWTIPNFERTYKYHRRSQSLF